MSDLHRAQRVESIPQLRPMLDAIARGTKRSRLRMMVIVCRNGHTIGEVFPSPDGPFVVWQQEISSSSPGERDADWFKRKPTEWVAASGRQQLQDRFWPLSPCRCSTRNTIDIAEFALAAKRGDRRVVVHNGKVALNE